jgi:undecaprenyl-diphosphatase
VLPDNQFKATWDARAILLAAALGFSLLAGAAQFGFSAAFDRAVLLGLRTPGDLADPAGPVWLEEAARDITALGGGAILALATLAVALNLAANGRGRLALFAVLTVLGAQVMSETLKALLARPRPDLVAHEVAVYSASLPSGHAMMAAACFFTLAFTLARAAERRRNQAFLYTIAAVLVVLVGLSRLYLGVHWPTDVAAGWCAGIAWASAAALIYRRITLIPADSAPAPPR